MKSVDRISYKVGESSCFSRTSHTIAGRLICAICQIIGPDGSLYAFQNPEGIPSSILERQTTEAELRLQEDRRKLAQDKRDFEKEKSDFSKEKCRWAFERAEDEWEVEKQTRLANVGVPMQKALNRRKELDNHCMELQLRRREALALER